MRNFAIILLVIISCTSKDDSRPYTVTHKLISEHVFQPDYYWLEHKIHSAKLFLYFPEWSGTTDNIVVNGKLHETIYDTIPMLLDSNRIQEIQRMLAFPIDHTSAPTDCYEPHHGIVYYDERGEIIGHVSICFMCHQANGDGDFFGMEYYKTLIDSIGLPYDEHYTPFGQSALRYHQMNVFEKLKAAGYEFPEEY